MFGPSLGKNLLRTPTLPQLPTIVEGTKPETLHIFANLLQNLHYALLIPSLNIGERLESAVPGLREPGSQHGNKYQDQ